MKVIDARGLIGGYVHRPWQPLWAGAVGAGTDDVAGSQLQQGRGNGGEGPSVRDPVRRVEVASLTRRRRPNTRMCEQAGQLENRWRGRCRVGYFARPSQPSISEFVRLPASTGIR
jgi:hypothetical protein